MNYYRKMVLLPVDEYNKYKSLLYTSQLTVTRNPIQKDLNEMREVYGTTLPDDERVKLEGEIIQKHKTKSKLDDNIKVSIPPKHERIKELIQDFSKTNKTRATQMYNHLSSKYKSRWNDDGEIVDDHGNPIKGSNILDLINYVTTNQNIFRTPTGLSQFLRLMKTANTPSYMISKRGHSNIEDSGTLEDEEQEVDDNINMSNEYTGLEHLFTEKTPRKRKKGYELRSKKWIQ